MEKKEREAINQKGQSVKGTMKHCSLWKENGASLSSLTWKQNINWNAGTIFEEY